VAASRYPVFAADMRTRPVNFDAAALANPFRSDARRLTRAGATGSDTRQSHADTLLRLAEIVAIAAANSEEGYPASVAPDCHRRLLSRSGSRPI